MDQNHQEQRRDQASPGNQQRLKRGPVRKYDQEIGSFRQVDEYDHLETDFEVGGLTSDLEAGLKPDFEIGELEQNYEITSGEQQRQRRRQQVQRTQRQQDDR